MRIISEYGTPQRVVRHCKEVTRVALAIASELNKKGCDLDLNIIQAAGLLHDVARVEKDHEKAGSILLKELGYPYVAEIISRHMRYSEFHLPSEMTETDIVCLGDRLVKEDEFVGLDERMDYVIQKMISWGKEDAVPVILAKKEQVRSVICEIEKLTGKSLDEICR